MIRPIFLLTIVIFSTLPFSLFAQDRKQAPQAQRFSIGIKVGPSLTFASYPDETQRDQFSSKPKFGYGGMGFIIFPLNKTRYSFITEAGYAIRGRKIEYGGGLSNNATYQFVEMSMGLRRSFDLKIRKNLPSKWFINVGPNVQYWVSGKGKFVTTPYEIAFLKSPELPPSTDIFTNFVTDANRWLFGADIGIGADAPINKRQTVRLELRLTLGQTFLGKKGSVSNYGSLEWQDPLQTNLKTISFTGAYTVDFDMRARKMGKSTKDKVVKRRR
jgi:hypothetical protein